MPIDEKKQQEVFDIAREFYQQNPDWVTFFGEVLGLDGIVRKAFPDPEEMAEFERTHEYRQIQEMLAALRQRATGMAPKQEPTTVITVRLPKSLHEALKAEAHERRTSMNKLCIAKLIKVLESKEAAEEAARLANSPEETESETR
ncbi:Hypothetical protein PBC10988_38190 [Planctomycetales bacterium 10988]|nr:Hypothetical protein PBC10988_38190 [Planctomycetales bacterium 10988]